MLQEVFANAYNAILADQREINVRPWLYRIARNRCLNHLRRPTADASDTMDEHMDAHGRSTADVVHRRADVRHLLEDVQKLAESQRTALLLREIDALSYDQIAEAMETTIPSVKSLLVRARMSLAEAAEARQLSCDDVRLQLAEVSEGLKKASPALRRHVRECEECHEYKAQLRKTTTAMAIAFPIGPLLILKKLVLAKLGSAALAGGGGGAAAGGTAATGAAGATGAVTAATGAATGVAGTAAAGGAAGGLAGAGGLGIGAVASKAVAGVAVTAVIAGGAVEAKRVAAPDPVRPAVSAPAQVKQAPAVNPTGGASLEGAPAELTAPAKEQAAEPPAQASTAPDETVPDTGATGEAGATPPAMKKSLSRSTSRPRSTAVPATRRPAAPLRPSPGAHDRFDRSHGLHRRNRQRRPGSLASEAEAAKRLLQDALVADARRRVRLVQRGGEHRDQQPTRGILPRRMLLLGVLVVVGLRQHHDPAVELARLPAAGPCEAGGERELVPLDLVHARAALELEAEVFVAPRGIALQVRGDQGEVTGEESLAPLHPERRHGEARDQLAVAAPLGAHVRARRLRQLQLGGVVEAELDRVEAALAGVGLGLLVAVGGRLAADHERRDACQQQHDDRAHRSR